MLEFKFLLSSPLPNKIFIPYPVTQIDQSILDALLAEKSTATCFVPHPISPGYILYKTDTGKFGIIPSRLYELSKPQRGCRYLVAKAVKYGVLRQPDHCESCNKTLAQIIAEFSDFSFLRHGRGGVPPLMAHHWDYTLPLHVSWFCRKCHDCYDSISMYESIKREAMKEYLIET